MADQRFEDAVATVMRWAQREWGAGAKYEAEVRAVITEIQGGAVYTDRDDHEPGECHVCDALRVLRLLDDDDDWFRE